MQALDGATYDAQAPWEQMFNPVAVEVRTAADRPSPLASNIDRVARRQDIARHRAATEAASDQRNEFSSTVQVADIDRAFFDPWFSQTMGILASARDAHAIDAAQMSGVIGTAEMLAAFLSEVDPSIRPQLTLDDDGNTSYGTSIDDFYLNLTIDSPGKITWYAVVGQREHFEEGTSFNGRSLPNSLRDVLQLPSV